MTMTCIAHTKELHEGYFGIEVDRISVLVSVSAPKLVKSSLSAWFHFR